MHLASASHLLDPDVISSAEQLGLHARQIVEGLMTGGNKSPFHGFAAEFSQHREYAPGDELRHLDWKLFGRSDRTFIRQYGKAIAACLSYLILQQRDAAAIELFDTVGREAVPRARTLGEIDPVLMALASSSAHG